MKFLALFFCFSLKAFAQFQIGDAGQTFDETRFDPRFPDMKEWAKAGVQGGIPLRNTLKIQKAITPQNNLQEAIDEVAAQGGGVILLKMESTLFQNPLR